MTVTPEELPAYSDLMYPVLLAVKVLGGSASGREIIDQVLETEGFTDEEIALTYGSRDKSVLVDRLELARSYCKLSGALESPARKLYLLSALGHEVLGLPEAAARERLVEMDKEVRKARRKPKSTGGSAEPHIGSDPVPAVEESEEDSTWMEALLGRLHALSSDGFEEFCLYLLRLFGLQLTRTGRSGDEGIDGVGIAPLSDVLSATVAVQAKKYDPSTAIGREPVALFQRDASAVGAERAIFITLGRFTAAARKAANSITPHVDLIDGERLCELMLSKEVGVRSAPVAMLDWFDRFD